VDLDFWFIFAKVSGSIREASYLAGIRIINIEASLVYIYGE